MNRCSACSRVLYVGDAGDHCHTCAPPAPTRPSLWQRLTACLTRITRRAA